MYGRACDIVRNVLRVTGTALLLVFGALLAAACAGDTTGPQAEPTPTEYPFAAITSTLATLPTGYRIETVLEGLSFPTSIAATPDGRLLIGEQATGRVRVVQDGRLLDEPWAEFPAHVPEGQFIQELGFDGIAVDPDFAENHYVYVYYTQRDLGEGRRTVFARLTDQGGKGTNAKELLSVELAPLLRHAGGGIAFQGDAILLGVGDHERGDLARDVTSVAGKVLRIDRDGNALPDNPYVATAGADARIYAIGVRNPFGIAVDGVSGRVFFTDNREVAGDALYELRPGTDYGWPDEQYALREPVVIYDEPQGVAGMVAYRGMALPEFDGTLLFCSYHEGGALHWSRPDATGLDLAQRDLIIAPGCSSSLTVGVDGFVYFLSLTAGRLLRISR